MTMMDVRTCGECQFGKSLTCSHPTVPPLAMPHDPKSKVDNPCVQARYIEQTIAKVDGVRPAWCPLTRVSVLVRPWREPLPEGAL